MIRPLSHRWGLITNFHHPNFFSSQNLEYTIVSICPSRREEVILLPYKSLLDVVYICLGRFGIIGGNESCFVQTFSQLLVVMWAQLRSHPFLVGGDELRPL